MRRFRVRWKTMVVLLLLGMTALVMEARAEAHPLSVPPVILEGPATILAQAESGYVDMEGHEPGDLFVDEDGDGLDDRLLRKHQKRKRKHWRDDHWQEGGGSENGKMGSGGHAGHGGSGPGRGGR